jgi:PKHD-type hydroxylase
MSLQSLWYFTGLPDDVVNSLCDDLASTPENLFIDSHIKKGNINDGTEGAGNVINADKRNSKHAWISTNHWIGGFLWHYIMKANRENFLYDLTNIDGEFMQYTVYNEGCYYKWHTDTDISTWRTPQTLDKGEEIKKNHVDDFLAQSVEQTRKLSGVLQLSDPEDYEGGSVQIMGGGGNTYFLPKRKGTLAFFDSRSMHRVQPIKSGERRSLVFWVNGPRWR